MPQLQVLIFGEIQFAKNTYEEFKQKYHVLEFKGTKSEFLEIFSKKFDNITAILYANPVEKMIEKLDDTLLKVLPSSLQLISIIGDGKNKIVDIECATQLGIAVSDIGAFESGLTKEENEKQTLEDLEDALLTGTPNHMINDFEIVSENAAARAAEVIAKLVGGELEDLDIGDVVQGAFEFRNVTIVGPSVATIKKFVKDFCADIVSKDVVFRKKRKKGILKNGAVYRIVLSDKAVGDFWKSKTGNITESDSIDMKKKFLIKKTSVNYREKDFLEGKNKNQIPKNLRLITKQALSKSLDKINFLDNDNDDDILLDNPVVFSLPLKNLINVFKICLGKACDSQKVIFKNQWFWGTSIFSKFAEIIKAKDVKILVNTNLKKFSEHLDWAVMVKKIPVRTSVKTVHAALSKFGMIKSIKIQLVKLWQKAVIEFNQSDQADLVAAR
ncbi:hypothetical protein G9A89_011824 [Geosiphon pyriformis]|nr:hypothetical protein G9A89_011824 [Geosiphon pyriformis]